MSIFNSGIEDSKVRVAGVDALRVMLGTGSEAVEVWPGFYDVSYNFTFPNDDQLKWAPISGFDGRTSNSAQHARAFVFNDMLVAGDNAQPAYNTRLVDRQIDGDITTYEVVMGDVVNTKDKPSYLVLASNIILTHMLVLEFGRDGTALRTVIDGVASSAYQYNTTFATNDRLTVIWNRPANSFNLFKNGVSFGAHVVNYAGFKNTDGRMYPGFGLYSTAGHWSTRLKSVKISGKTSYRQVLVASDSLSRITIPRSTQTEVARSVIHTGGVTDIRVVGAGWAQASSSGLRTFRILVNGAVRDTSPDEGGFVSVSGVNLGPNSVVTVEAYADTSNESYRNVTRGVLQIGSSALPT